MAGEMKTREIRPEVQQFAELMEEVLRQNDRKGGWRQMPLGWLIKRLLGEAHELYQGYYEPQYTMHGWQYSTKEHLRKECADIANFAMMISDVLDDKADTRPWEREEEQA